MTAPRGCRSSSSSSPARPHDLTLGFGYNPASQIVQAARSNEVYAPVGPFAASRAYTANGLNQYTAWGQVSPTYDARGNLTSAGGATYAYSSENRLVSASGGISLAYDPHGRLFQTIGPATTRFGYDGDALIAEHDGSNKLLRRYVHGPGVDEPLVWYEGAGTSDRRWLHADERGSIVAVSDGSGSATNVNRYDEYGIPAATNVGRFQYTGQTWLPSLQMYHYKARIYSPALGRFLQVDPIGYDDQFNLYAYVRNDPINMVDPAGEQAIPAPGCIGCHSRNTPTRTPATPSLPDVRSLGTAAGAAGKAFTCVINPISCLATAARALMSEAKPTGNDIVINDHIAGLLDERGWTEGEVRDITRTDPTGTSIDNRTVDGERLNDRSTVYGSRDAHVVVNDRTGEVVQVSDKNDPNWKPDGRIRWENERER